MSRARPSLVSPRLELRLPEPGDVPALIRYHEENAGHLAPWTPLRPINFNTEAFWYGQLLEIGREFEYDLGVRFTLFSIEEPGRVVGNIGLTAIVRGIAQFCYVGYALAASEEGKGLMSEGLTASLDYTWDELKLHRVMANYMPRNERSARLLERQGFRVEGLAREYLCIAGRWEDHVLTAKVNPR